MPLRMIKYKVAAIEDFLQGKPEGTPWPTVLCACFYHDKTAPYLYSTSVYDYTFYITPDFNSLPLSDTDTRSPD